MISYSSWITKTIRVTDINLDAENPRIPPTPSPLAQLELIHLFCRHYQIDTLAKSIVEDGYFPDERIVVIEQGGSAVVLEGNRRVASLKALLNPDLTPNEMKIKFQRLSETVDKKMISQCEALIAPSRDAATKLILEKHTQQSVLGWSPLMKAEFYRKLTDQGPTVSDIAQKYNLATATIQDFIRTSRIYRIALATDLTPEVKELVSDPQKFPISTLERVYNNSDARKALTLSNDLSSISCPPFEFKKALSTIVSDIAIGKQDSRSLDKAEEINKYVRDVVNNVGLKETSTPIRLDEIITQHQPTFSLTLKSTTKLTHSTRKSKGLFGATDIPFKLKGATSLKRLYDELRILPVKNHANTTAILFRVFIDKACRHFLKRKGIRNINVGQESIKLADANFGDILDYLCGKENIIIHDPNIKKAVRIFKNSPGFRSLSTLNSIIHNEELSFNESQARDLYPNMEGFLKILLSE